MTTAYLTTNNAYDAFVIIDANGLRFHTIPDARTFAEALMTGDNQDIDNWSGEWLVESENPEDVGTVIATNDGTKCVVVNARLLKQRAEFWGHNWNDERASCSAA